MRALQIARRVLSSSAALRPAVRRVGAPSLASLASSSSSATLTPFGSRSFARSSVPFYHVDEDDEQHFEDADEFDDFDEDEEDEEDDKIRYPPSKARVGFRAPRFTANAVVDGEITSLSLDDYAGQYVVLFFYPKDFTYVCPTEITAFNDRADEFAALNAQLIAVSTDSAESHLAWTKIPRSKGGLGAMQIPLVADLTKSIAANYGVLIEDEGIALRGLFVIDRDRVLQQMTVNNLPVGRSVDETLRLLRAFQFHEEHGEVCPANWQPGAKTIVANPQDSHKYFSQIGDDSEEDDKSHEGMTVVSTKAAFQQLIKSGDAVVAKFEAPWCGKCSQIQPFVKELAAKHKDVTFATLDVTKPEIEELKAELGVDALPAFHFYKGGKEVGTPVLGYKKSPLKNAVEKFF
ncbi:hypothetical protein P43SY_009522 [Pythium insidiosum]|uniref:thioredoxin-dependent peroxiredoxin n=1 Tax=Pythium insidiosum TaxID=114742 RepID=A0AAD5LJF5_PYTIN|nr:hypothetical protein P43SY_009522 [Pythium insidiosum]